MLVGVQACTVCIVCENSVQNVIVRSKEYFDFIIRELLRSLYTSCYNIGQYEDLCIPFNDHLM